jgi:amino acid transporter
VTVLRTVVPTVAAVFVTISVLTVVDVTSLVCISTVVEVISVATVLATVVVSVSVVVVAVADWAKPEEHSTDKAKRQAVNKRKPEITF